MGSLSKLITACQNGDVELTENLIGKDPTLIHLFDSDNFNCLLTAIHHHQNNCVAAILCHPQTDLLSIKNKFGSTVLHVAIYKKNLVALNMVLDWLFKKRKIHILIDQADVWGKTPLHQAVYHNFFRGVQRLLEFFPNLNALDIQKKKPEDFCQQNKFHIRHLLQAYRIFYEYVHQNKYT